MSLIVWTYKLSVLFKQAKAWAWGTMTQLRLIQLRMKNSSSYPEEDDYRHIASFWAGRKSFGNVGKSIGLNILNSFWRMGKDGTDLKSIVKVF